MSIIVLGSLGNPCYHHAFMTKDERTVWRDKVDSDPFWKNLVLRIPKSDVLHECIYCMNVYKYSVCLLKNLKSMYCIYCINILCAP